MKPINILNLFRTVRPKALIYIAATAILSILFIEFVFLDIKTEYAILYMPAPVYLKLCYSLLSAFIFYFFAVHLPRERRRAKVYRPTANKITSINREIFQIIYIIRDVSKIPSIDPIKLNSKDLLEACNSINTRQFVTEGDVVFKDWFDYILHKKNIIANLMQALMQMNDVIDSDLQETLSLIDDIFLMQLNFEIVKPGNLDLSNWSYSIFELVEESKQMMKVFSEKYSKYYSYLYHESARKKNIQRKIV